MDRLKVFLEEKEADQMPFSSEKGFYPSKTSPFSQLDSLSKTFGGRARNLGRAPRKSKFGNWRDKENRKNRQNLVHPFVGVRDYGDYSGMKYSHFAQRKVPSAPFSERKLMLEMQRWE